MKLKYNIKLTGIIEKIIYLDLFDLPPETILPPHSLVIDTEKKEFYLVPWEEGAKEITLSEFCIRFNYLFITSIYSSIPKGLEEDEYREIVCATLQSIGAIPKKDLVVGKVYQGDCRNSEIAIYLGNGKFEYIRYKFGFTYLEEINHYEDDNGYDLFVPIKELEDNSNWLEKYEKVKKENNH